jgi:hypothetical protein
MEPEDCCLAERSRSTPCGKFVGDCENCFKTLECPGAVFVTGLCNSFEGGAKILDFLDVQRGNKRRSKSNSITHSGQQKRIQEKTFNKAQEIRKWFTNYSGNALRLCCSKAAIAEKCPNIASACRRFGIKPNGRLTISELWARFVSKLRCKCHVCVVVMSYTCHLSVVSFFRAVPTSFSRVVAHLYLLFVVAKSMMLPLLMNQRRCKNRWIPQTWKVWYQPPERRPC